MAQPPAPDIRPGLEGVVLTETRTSSIDGERGELLLCGFPVEELAPQASFEQVTALLWHDQLPGSSAGSDLSERLKEHRELPEGAREVLVRAATAGLAPMDALAAAAGTLRTASSGDPALWDEETAVRLTSLLPTLVASYARLRDGKELVAPRRELGHAEHFLYLLDGEIPDPSRVRALETYLNTVSDHGMNASTFTARVIVSTRSDLVSAVVGAIGALKGPLHGGAPGPALDMVFEIGDASRAEEVLRAKLDRGERLMGFGHRVYRVRDPRADVLAAAARELADAGTARDLYDLARSVEQVALRLLAEFKPDRRLDTNVEFYTALVLHSVGLSSDLFSPVFAMGRVAGWLAHCKEQLETGRLIRPSSVFSGERRSLSTASAGGPG